MTTMTNKIYNELVKRIEAADFEPITVTMKVNDDSITITPCVSYGDEKGWANIEYYLMDSEVLNLYGSEKLEKVAETLANYSNLLEENDAEIKSLKAYVAKHGESSDWDWVSDWHKDLFGHRPHVPHSQIIAWAKSDSVNSVRLYA